MENGYKHPRVGGKIDGHSVGTGKFIRDLSRSIRSKYFDCGFVPRVNVEELCMTLCFTYDRLVNRVRVVGKGGHTDVATQQRVELHVHSYVNIIYLLPRLSRTAFSHQGMLSLASPFKSKE